jgi:DNA-directed RNA polymerase beta subunit
MAYQSMVGPEDLFSERVNAAHRVMRPLLWKASFRKNLSPFSAGFLNSQINGAIMTSGLGQPLEEVNPADLLNQVTRISRLGEGGIPSLQSVPEEARNVQPSHFGFVDPLLTPK